MSTPITNVAVNSGTNAALIAAREQETARQACTVYVQGYAHERATVAEMREYAGCIERLYPSPVSEESLWVAKGAVLVMFAAVVAGIIWEKRTESMMTRTWLGAVFWGGLAGAALGVIVLAAIGGVWFGVRVLMS